MIDGITDMRNGFNGLSTKVQTALKADALSRPLLIFRSLSGIQVNMLWSISDGLCLLTSG